MKKMDQNGLIAALGLAIFLIIYATQVWGGIFPFLPDDFQTKNITILFYLSQTIAFVAALATSVVGSYYFPTGTRHMLIALATTLVAAGSLCIIAAMYSQNATILLVMTGGVLLGVGTAAFFMLWQRYFSSIEPDASNLQLMVGGALAAIVYYLLYLVPTALTAFLIPIVLLPLGALCLTLAVRTIDLNQPMFEDVPHQHPDVYRNLAHDIWRNTVAVAALGFAYGIARSIAVTDEASIGAIVNIASMAGLFGASILLLFLAHFRSVRFGLLKLFRFLYPVVLTIFLVFPFLGPWGISFFAGVAYLAFSAIVLVMMMQCAQISRDRGTNPVFVYGMPATAAYGAEALGFLLGWFGVNTTFSGVNAVSLLSMIAAYVIGISFFLVSRPPTAKRKHSISLIELTRPRDTTTTPRIDGIQMPIAQKLDIPRDDERQFRDRLSKQCLVAQVTYALSSREAEVTELIARGRSVTQIAEELFISENTVRTHSKHIYTKMDVHSKQELTMLLDGMNLSILSE